MPTVEWTQADVDALKASIQRGVLEVTYTAAGASRTVRYQSLSDMLQLLSTMSASVTGSTTRFAAFSKGV